MKIVIELSDETYKDIKEENSIYGINNGLSARITGKVVGAIQNGIPLPKKQWIPVSERLPKKNVEVLATTKSGYVTMAERLEYDCWVIHEGSSNAHTDELTAWKPLPEPYKAESEE